MSLPVPKNRQDWEMLARQNNVPVTQFFSECSALPSGSKFTMEHYLPLRILVTNETSLNRNYRKMFRNRHLRPEIRKKVSAAMKENKSLQAVQKFLTKSTNIGTKWNAKHYRAVGPFGNGPEKLYQIVSPKPLSGIDSEDRDEDTTNLEIFASTPSPPPPPLFGQELSTAFQNMYIDHNPATPNRRGRLERNQNPPNYRDFEDEDQVGESPSTELSSAPNTDKRVAQLDFERTTLVPSDEQSVNMCLENLLIALSNVMGFYGRLVSDRRAFVIPKDHDSNLYQACVDGLIMTPDRQGIMAFIEVKRSLRSLNDSVYRQVGAQMAAFIYNYDRQINRNRYAESLQEKF